MCCFVSPVGNKATCFLVQKMVMSVTVTTICRWRTKYTIGKNETCCRGTKPFHYVHNFILAAASEKVPWNIRKMHRFRSSYVCAKYHAGFLLYPMILLADSEGPDQSTRMLPTLTPRLGENNLFYPRVSDSDSSISEFGHIYCYK